MTPGAQPRPFLTAKWRDLLLLNYRMPADLLTPQVPAGTELDSWDGSAFVSLVGFLFRDTRIRGVAVPWHRSFEEVNLRFYVRRRGDASRRGVVFLKELVPRRLVASVARWAYNEPYHRTAMGHRIELDKRGLGSVAYHWGQRAERCDLGAQVTTEAEVPDDGSAPQFFAEHHWGYTRQRDGGTIEYEVARPRWRVSALERWEFLGDPKPWYGGPIGAHLLGPAYSGYYSPGSEVVVMGGIMIC